MKSMTLLSRQREEDRKLQKSASHVRNKHRSIFAGSSAACTTGIAEAASCCNLQIAKWQRASLQENTPLHNE